MAEAEILELYELPYSDLKLLCLDNTCSSSTEEIKRLETVRTSVMENLGPGGPGLLSITSVPNASIHRRNLLLLARKLALLNPDDRKRLLKVTPLPFARSLTLFFIGSLKLTMPCFVYDQRNSVNF